MKVKNSLPFLFLMFIANCIYHWRTLSRILKCVGARGEVKYIGLTNAFYIWVKLDSGLDVEWDSAKGWNLEDYYKDEYEVKRKGGHVVMFNPETALDDLKVLLKGVPQEKVKSIDTPVMDILKTYYEGEKK